MQYLTDEKGERTAVVLDIRTYQALMDETRSDPELLSDLSQDELEALAESQLSPGTQGKLNELLEKQKMSTLTDDEIAKLDHLIEQVDQLNVLKTRAHYTLQKLFHS